MKNDTQTIWKYIKADALFRDYLPHIKSYKYKIRGKNSRGNPAQFSKKEIEEVWQAIRKMMDGNTWI